MRAHRYTVTCLWDDEARIWYVPELLELNAPGFAACARQPNSASPAWMEFRRQRTDDDRAEVSIHLLPTHDDDGSSLCDLTVPRGIEIGEVDRETLGRRQLRRIPSSRSSRSTVSLIAYLASVAFGNRTPRELPMGTTLISVGVFMARKPER
jgi:hypothetical protein